MRPHNLASAKFVNESVLEFRRYQRLLQRVSTFPPVRHMRNEGAVHIHCNTQPRAVSCVRLLGVHGAGCWVLHEALRFDGQMCVSAHCWGKVKVVTQHTLHEATLGWLTPTLPTPDFQHYIQTKDSR